MCLIQKNLRLNNYERTTKAINNTGGTGKEVKQKHMVMDQNGHTQSSTAHSHKRCVPC